MVIKKVGQWLSTFSGIKITSRVDEHRLLGPKPRVSDSVTGQRICISNQFSGDADTVGSKDETLRTTVEVNYICAPNSLKFLLCTNIYRMKKERNIRWGSWHNSWKWQKCLLLNSFKNIYESIQKGKSPAITKMHNHKQAWPMVIFTDKRQAP